MALYTTGRHLPTKSEAALLKFVAQAFFVSGLKQAWPKLTMHFYGEANHLFGQTIICLRR